MLFKIQKLIWSELLMCRYGFCGCTVPLILSRLRFARGKSSWEYIVIKLQSKIDFLHTIHGCLYYKGKSKERDILCYLHRRNALLRNGLLCELSDVGSDVMALNILYSTSQK